jgi:NAD(P)-dependent dehydrogenase (short-subunit alcohol dehydrogenase family)
LGYEMAREAGKAPAVPRMRVLVTGGASGIGAAIARRFVDDGARVAVLDRDQHAMSELNRVAPGVALPLRGDVTDVDSVDHVFTELDRAWGGLDVVLSNAGTRRELARGYGHLRREAQSVGRAVPPPGYLHSADDPVRS